MSTLRFSCFRSAVQARRTFFREATAGLEQEWVSSIATPIQEHRARREGRREEQGVAYAAAMSFTIDVADVIDNRPLSRFQLRVFASCLAIAQLLALGSGHSARAQAQGPEPNAAAPTVGSRLLALGSGHSLGPGCSGPRAQSPLSAFGSRLLALGSALGFRHSAPGIRSGPGPEAQSPRPNDHCRLSALGSWHWTRRWASGTRLRAFAPAGYAGRRPLMPSGPVPSA